jgi:hypothetical protein
MNPAHGNARVLLFAAIALAAISAVRLLIFDRSSTFFGSVLDIAGFVVAVVCGLVAFRHMGTFTIPAELPKDFQSYQTVTQGLRRQSIHGQSNVLIFRDIKYFLLRLIPDSSLANMNPRVRDVAVAQAKVGTIGLIPSFLIIVGGILSLKLTMLPFVAAAFAWSGYYVWLMSHFRQFPGEPITRTMESHGSDKMGHPRTLLKQVYETKARELHGGGGLLRLVISEPEIGTARGNYSATLFFEAQPRVVEAGTHSQLGSVVFPLAAITFLAAFLGLHLGLTVSSLGFPLVFLSGSVLALCVQAMIVAWTIDGAYRFVSDLLLVDIEGTYDNTKIESGRGIHDSHTVSRDAVVATAQIYYYASEALSETSSGILSERTLVGLRATNHSRTLVEAFKASAEGFLARGISQVGIQFDGAITEIELRNARMSGAHAQMQTIGMQTANNGLGGGQFSAPTQLTPPDSPAPARISESSADLKTCPECAESVKTAAKKCRFCGYSFESVQTANQPHV